MSKPSRDAGTGAVSTQNKGRAHTGPTSDEVLEVFQEAAHEGVILSNLIHVRGYNSSCPRYKKEPGW